MVLFTCSCLNVKVNLLGDKKEAQSTLPSSFKGVWFQGEFGVGGIKIEHRKLVSIRKENGHQILHCSNCLMDVVVIPEKIVENNPFYDGQEDFEEQLSNFMNYRGTLHVSTSCLSQAEISEAKLRDNYSEVFQIIINDDLSNKKNSLTDISLDKEYHDILLTLHHTVTVEFSKREKEMKERIRKFEEEQKKELNAQQARAHLDRQKVWNSICVVNYESLVKKKRTQSQPVEFGEDPLTSSLQTKSNQKEQFKQNYPSPSMLSSSLVTSREKPKSGRYDKMKATFSQEYQTQNLETTQRQNSRPQIINQDQQITQEMQQQQEQEVQQQQEIEKQEKIKAKKQEVKTKGKEKEESKNLEKESNEQKSFPIIIGSLRSTEPALFNLDGFEDEEDDETEEIEEEEEEEEEEDVEEEEVPKRRENQEDNKIKSLFGTSFPVTIPSQFSHVSNFEELGSDEDNENSPEFEAPHEIIAKTYTTHPEVLFGERPGRKNFSYGL